MRNCTSALHETVVRFKEGRLNLKKDDDDTTLIAEQELDIRLLKPQTDENVLNNRGDLGTLRHNEGQKQKKSPFIPRKRNVSGFSAGESTEANISHCSSVGSNPRICQ